jgi:hypothetical protein
MLGGRSKAASYPTSASLAISHLSCSTLFFSLLGDCLPESTGLLTSGRFSFTASWTSAHRWSGLEAAQSLACELARRGPPRGPWR